MRWRVGTAEDSPLARRLTALGALRLGVLTAFLALTERVYFSRAGWGSYSGAVALATVGGAFVLSAVYGLLLRRGKLLGPLAHVQLLTDQIAWTAIAYISGGVTSGAVALYGLTVLSGAITLYRAGALSAALSGIACYLALCGGFATGLVRPPPDQALGAYMVDADEMIYPALSAVMTTVVVALLAAYLADRLRAAGGKLREAEHRAARAEQLAGLGRLAASLAHEIRNPLGSIRGSIELLRTGGSLGEEDVRLCEIVEREVARLDGLVGDMTHLGRPREPVMAPTDLAQTAQAVVRLARSSSRGTDVTVDYEGPDQLGVVADAAQLRQLLWNLVRNAMQACKTGGRVLVRVDRHPDGGVGVQVRDDGEGIPPSEQERIFDPFYSTRSHGMGIGLAVVKQVADAHGFDLELRSATDAGATFEVKLPRAALVATTALLCLALAGACTPSGWREPVADAPDDLTTGDDGWTTAAALGGARPGRPSEASREPGSADAGHEEPEDPVAIRSEGAPDRPPDGTADADLFRNTYYDFPREPARGARTPLETIYDPSCTPIVQVARSFHDQLCVQGSGRLLSGQTVSFAKRDCPCAATCPRTGQKICFEALDPARFPHGRGARGTAITPTRTVAVDPAVVPLGTVLYIPDFHGLRDLAGQAHDGCFVAEDRGLRVQGRHLDVFTGDPELTRAWNAAVPSNKGVRAVLGARRCAHLARP